MNVELIAAIKDRQYWMERFTRQHYFNAFKKYTETYGPLYIAAVRKANDEAGLKAMAEELLGELEASWAKERFWKRTRAKFDDKEMIIGYYTPMLLGLPESRCRRFAEILQEIWTERWPKDGYRVAEYKQIRDGFRNVVLGIELKDELRPLEDKIEEAERNKKNIENQ